MIQEITVKSIITKSGLPDADYVINPYVGCANRCIYCYARFMKRFSGHTEEWGSFVDVKKNAPDLVPVNTSRYRDKALFLSSVTDPYCEPERLHGVTRRLIERLIPLAPRLSVQTKSSLVVRDTDLFVQFAHCEVGMTVTSLDEAVRQEIEPSASTVEDRLSALKKLHEAGIRNYIFIGPILPNITDWKRIIEATRGFVDCFMFENLNIKGTVRHHVNRWLAESHPGLVDEYTEIYSRGNGYWQDTENDIRSYCAAEGVEYKLYFHHKSTSKNLLLEPS
ncbi:MAG: radical SAM protein [Spirochaetales bacterium]|nr:radical SAM protein [Spirochaetales bacterium]